MKPKIIATPKSKDGTLWLIWKTKGSFGSFVYPPGASEKFVKIKQSLN